MATARDLITDALVELGVLAGGETATADDAALALSRLNSMLDTWNAEGLMIYAHEEAVYLLAANTQSPTIGASGTFTATRPVKIDEANSIDISSTQVSGTTATTGAGDSILTDSGKNFTTLGVVAGRDLVYVISGTGVTAGIYKISTVGTTTLTLTSNPGSSGSSISYRVVLIPARTPIDCSGDEAWWASLQTRGAAGTPEALWYNPSYANGTINLYPVSSSALGLELFTRTQLTAFASLDTTVSVPPAYYEALFYSLAVRLAPSFGLTPNALTIQMAADTRSRAKSLNSHAPRLVSDVPTGSRW